MINFIATEAVDVLTNEIWKTMLDGKSNSLLRAKSITLSWFSGSFDIIDSEHLAEKMRSVDDKVKEL